MPMSSHIEEASTVSVDSPPEIPNQTPPCNSSIGEGIYEANASRGVSESENTSLRPPRSDSGVDRVNRKVQVQRLTKAEVFGKFAGHGDIFVILVLTVALAFWLRRYLDAVQMLYDVHPEDGRYYG